MPNYHIMRTVERLARLAYPACSHVRAGGSTRWGRQAGWQLNGDGPGDGRGRKFVYGTDATGTKVLASGDSFRRIRDDLTKLLRSRGVDPDQLEDVT